MGRNSSRTIPAYSYLQYWRAKTMWKNNFHSDKEGISDTQNVSVVGGMTEWNYAISTAGLRLEKNSLLLKMKRHWPNAKHPKSTSEFMPSVNITSLSKILGKTSAYMKSAVLLK